ncbi:MAG: acyltransferase [Phycisphaeraceae bacterium]|nr:acyltransferase [Phycisphaeraceae bacterium]
MAIETVRGLAIVILVAYHSHSSDLASSPLRGLYDGFYLVADAIQMPLFACIAGLVYAMRPVRGGQSVAFVVNKIRRLLVPFATAVTLTYVAQRYAPGATRQGEHLPLWRAYFFSYEQYWFLQALFLIFVLMALVEPVGLLLRPATWGVVLIASVVTQQLYAAPAFLSIWGVFYLLPSFLLGYGMGRFVPLLNHQAWSIVAAVVLTAGLVLLFTFEPGTGLGGPSRTGLVSVLTGLGAGYLLLRHRRAVPILPVLGACSYAIYLYHTFALALFKRLCLALDIQSHDLVFLIKWAAGLSVPILAAILIRRLRPARAILLGE